MTPDHGWTAPTESVGSRIRERYRVGIRDLVLSMLVGVHEFERHAPQRVSISVELALDFPESGFADGQYRTVYCYETLVARIRELAAAGHVVLVETFAERVADLALSDPRVCRVSVTVEKCDILPECAGVGATIEKIRG